MSGVGAVICEFDPLHRGHKKVIDLAKSTSDVVLAVLSGNFTQRSTPALFDKYTRARAAVMSGADLVVELPFPWSCSGVEYYAHGAVYVALSLGADSFCFGSENGDVNFLLKAADYSRSSIFKKALKKSEQSPEKGAAKTFDDAFRSGGFNVGKNDKLAIEYINAVYRNARKDVSFHTVKRIRSTDKGHVSASEIRDLIVKSGLSAAEEYVLPEAYGAYTSSSSIISDHDKFDYLEFLYFRFFNNYGLDDVFEASGGVGNRLLRAAASSTGPDEFFSYASTKKYTDSRIRRAALYSMLGVKKENLTGPPSFSILLAADKKGRAYLSDLKESEFSLITKPSDGVTTVPSSQFALEQKADELYSLCSDPPAEAGRFMRSSPYME